jgi:hypothetical protein
MGEFGTAFQIVDDILDATAPVEELGNTPGKDAAQVRHLRDYLRVGRGKKCALERPGSAGTIEAVAGATWFGILQPT